jgi:glycosyltransferase involved in cell wall biosynthesis
LPEDIEPVVAESRYYSNGFFKRAYNIVEAMFRQGDVNHITGDVHFLALLLKKEKTILTIHDLGFLSHPNFLIRKILKFFWLTMPVARVSRITAVSEATKKEIIQHTNCKEEKIQVIPTCIGSHFKRVDKAFNSVKPVILQIGTAGNKNCIRMAKALAGISCTLEIVGFPDKEYITVLREENIEHHISSRLTDDEMLRKYINCDILLFASTYEGFGMPIIEANTVGRAVVTSNCSSMPEVAGDAACLVDPFDVNSIREGVRNVIKNEKLRTDLVNKGYQNAKRFQLAGVAKAYSKIYNELA